MNNLVKEYIHNDNNNDIIIETGMLAKQADSSVIVKMGNTLILSTVVLSDDKKNIVNNYLPLTIDYRERFSASGKIPGGYIKREGKPTNNEIIVMRIIDRAIRPMFPKYFNREIQIMITLLSYDFKNSILPDTLSCLAASTALKLLNLPFYLPVSEVRIIYKNNKYIVNPNLDEINKSNINIVVGANNKSIIMLDGEMKEAKRENIITAINLGYIEIQKHIIAQEKLFSKINNKQYLSYKYEYDDIDYKKNDIFNIVKKLSYKKILNILKNKKKTVRKNEYNILLNNIKDKFFSSLQKKYSIYINECFDKIKKEIIEYFIFKKKKRIDGRKFDDIRNIYIKSNILPSTHGSALFIRGETQALSSVTLGNYLDINKIDDVIYKYDEKFYLHYNFLPFSTGEIKLVRGITRREIGHGYLAQKALKYIIPYDTPYTIRIVSDILESNGSSSMATICASSLALIDSGINIKYPVAGIAMGVFNKKSNKKKNNFIILSDISGEEDNSGNMDFKIASNANGITAIQMDLKKNIHVNTNLLNNIILKANKGIHYILDKMNEYIKKTKKIQKTNIPIIKVIYIPREYIGLLIGISGKTIQNIQNSTNTSVVIINDNKCENDIKVQLCSNSKNNIIKAIDMINSIIFIPKIGNKYKAIITGIKSYGIFVELFKGIRALLHISKIPYKYVNMIKYLKIGDIIEVKYLGKNITTGKIDIIINNDNV